jgi:vancomycin resistance protein VanJ
MPKESKGKKHLSWLRPFVWLNAFGVVGLSFSNFLVAERTWPTMLLAFLPSAIFLLPTVLLYIAIVRKRRWSLLLLNTVILVFGCIAIGGFRWGTHRAATKNTIRLLTFNVQHGALGWDRVAYAIRKASPDIVCLQEADEKAVEALKPRLPAYVFAHLGGEVIATTGRIFQAKGKPLPQGEGRAVLGATISCHGRNVHVVTTHCAPLDYGILAKFRPDEIAAHLETLAVTHEQQKDAILDFLQASDGPLVLCGDFNGPPAGVRYLRMTKNLSDAWDEAGQGFGYTLPSNFPLLRVDWGLVNSKIQVTSIAPQSEIASDHRGVIVDFEVSP